MAALPVQGFPSGISLATTQYKQIVNMCSCNLLQNQGKTALLGIKGKEKHSKLIPNVL